MKRPLITCPECDGAGEFDELQPARSSTQISPDYKQVICEICDGAGKIEEPESEEEESADRRLLKFVMFGSPL